MGTCCLVGSYGVPSRGIDSVQWRQMADMRNLVVHVYWGVSAQHLWDTIHQDLPTVIPLLKKVLEETSD
ncbi:MAG: HepT-like ribonuclease domain-containing protein [Thermodesulfobacteriota bacterium]